MKHNKIVLRGDIWGVHLGEGVGSEQRGHKFCLVVQNDIGNEFSPITVVIPITSKNKKYKATHVKINNLNEESYILCEQIRAVDKSRLTHRVARLTKKEMKMVDKKMKLQLGISS